AGRESIAQRRQRRRESRQLVIDRDTHRLKNAREIAWPGPGAESAPNRADEIVARFERPRPASANDLASEPARLGLVTIVAEHPDQIPLVDRGEPGRGIDARAGLHPHVEWRAFARSEAARLVVELPGR